jgi:hypothetical protein
MHVTVATLLVLVNLPSGETVETLRREYATVSACEAAGASHRAITAAALPVGATQTFTCLPHIVVAPR